MRTLPLGPAALAAVLLALPAIAGTTAPAGPSGDSIEKVTYSCADNQTMQVVFVNTASGSSYATLLEQDELIPMQIDVSASGARYTALNPAYNYELLTKGDKADLYATTAGKEERVKADCVGGN